MLNKRQRDFAEYYIQCGNASEAARQAGYSKGTATFASNWLNPKKPKKYNAELSEYISERITEIQKKKIATSEEVVIFFSSVLRGEEQYGEKPAIKHRIEAGKELLKRFDAAATEPTAQRKEDDPLTRALREEAKRLDNGGSE